ncbi:MAG: DUF4177 domain-containing protein [Pseudomonadota bacterium]
MIYEYKVIPAPRRGKRGPGVKGPAGKFAYALQDALNDLAASGWEFVRAETLGADEREGMMRKKVETFHGVLVFRREARDDPSEKVSSTPKSEARLAGLIPARGKMEKAENANDTTSDSKDDSTYEDASTLDTSPSPKKRITKPSADQDGADK